MVENTNTQNITLKVKGTKQIDDWYKDTLLND